jgi:hypothetical protein
VALFFFHLIRADGSTVEDGEGDDCPSPSAAADYAAKIAGELATEPAYVGSALLVTDEQGSEVAYVLIRGRDSGNGDYRK